MKERKKEQIYLNEKCRFYARTSRGIKPQMVYMNVKVNRERIVIPIGVKVVPNQFNVKKQQALVSNELTELENRNNVIVNETISFYRANFDAFINWLMSNPDKISEMKEYIYQFFPSIKTNSSNNVGNKVKRCDNSLENIFENQITYELKKNLITADRAKVKRSHMNIFYSFLKAKNIPSIWLSLSLKTYRDYYEYLCEVTTTAKGREGKPLNVTTINEYLSTLKALVNAVCERDVDCIQIDTRRWKLVKRTITKTEKKSRNYIFSEEQLGSIINLNLSGTKAIIRDLFVFGCYTGQRPADCCRLLRGEGKRFQSNGIEVISLLPHKTRKTDKVAYVPLFNPQMVDSIIDRFQTIPKYHEYLYKTDMQRNSLNSLYIKKIFQLAGLTDSYEVTTQNGNNIQTQEKNQASTAHFYLSRHYFITYMCRHGVSENDVIEMTGHTTTEQIHDTYEHLTREEKADKLTSNEAIRALVEKMNE